MGQVGTGLRPCAVFVECFEGPQALLVREVEARRPGPGEVAIDVHAAGVNFPDLLVSKGLYQDLYPLPFIIGKEGAGIVAAVGQSVAGFAVGDRVAFHIDAGAFSERVVVRAPFCFPVPKAISLLDAAAMFITYQTAWFALFERGALRRGEQVLVLGASGGVGIAALQLARECGAGVIAAVHGEAKAALARAHGADAVVDLDEPDLMGGLREQVARSTDGHGADLVIDTTGGVGFHAALRALAPFGRLVVIGFTSGTIPTVKVNYLLLKQISVVGMNWGFYRDGVPEQVARVQTEIFGLLAGRRIASPVTRSYVLADAAQALTALERRETSGKIVLTTRHAACAPRR